MGFNTSQPFPSFMDLHLGRPSFPRVGLRHPQAQQHLRQYGPGPSESSLLETTVAQMAMPQTKRQMRKIKRSSLAGHGDFPIPDCLHTRREVTVMTISFKTKLQKYLG